MPRDRKPIGPCSQCGNGTLICTINTFLNGEERIDSWEHRCPSCNYRETQANRSPVADGPSLVCPFCNREGAL
jgi:ssDNA-binding Zn-finger/Zn-ribbon topoisomerase 1